MISLFLRSSLSWGPICHAVIADEFAETYFPFLTVSQRSSFVRGAIYADGFDKSITHYISPIIDRLQEVLDDDSDLYWFFMGVFAHVPPDTFAHAGKSRSFIVPRGMFHYVSELVIDSVMMHRRPLPYFSLPSAIADELRRGNIRRSVFFRFAYPIIFVVAKLPLYRMVHWIEQDKCPKPNFEVSICNFVEHIKAMTQSLRETFPRLNELGFNDVRVREVSTRLVFNVSCCDQTWGRVGIAVEEDFFFSAPLLASVL